MERNIIASRAEELYERSEYAPACGKFLTPAEQSDFYDAAHRIGADRRLFFWGGAVGCDRRVPVFLPDYMTEGIDASYPCSRIYSEERERAFLMYTDGWGLSEVCGITPVRVSGGGFVSFGHRDYLGGILSIGIERDVLGDIVPENDSEAVVFLKDSIAPYIFESLTHIGRDKVTVKNAGIERDFVIKREFEKIVLLTASNRIDGIVRAFTCLSREDAQKAVTTGDVSVNYREVQNVDYRVSDGDIISVRGYGKFVTVGVAGETRSGRLRIDAKKYI